VLARLRQDAEAAREAAARLQNELKTLEAGQQAATAQLDGLLDELDPALAAAHGDGWQAAWRRDPAGWSQARAAEAAQW
ncbi:hypothetical protein FPK52_30495, partial [Acinetobacter baumannii]|nr:hypothetical protein [Acinetobacter baumannii]